VVVGIFLGLQVDDWNERRKLQQLESLYLDKLSAELLEMRDALEDKMFIADEAVRRMTAARDRRLDSYWRQRRRFGAVDSKFERNGLISMPPRRW
jgi:hypothetical protein